MAVHVWCIMLLAYPMQSVDVESIIGSVFHIDVRRINQIAQIIQGRNILCQYVGGYKRCNELASWHQMMCNNKKWEGVDKKDTLT
jgi:hypothetical protein